MDGPPRLFPEEDLVLLFSNFGSFMSHWITRQFPFVISSLTLHGFIALALVQIHLSPGNPALQEIHFVKLIEEKPISEVKKLSIPLPHKKKEAPPGPQRYIEKKLPSYPAAKEMSLPLAPVREKDPEQPAEIAGEDSPKEENQERLNPNEESGKDKGVVQVAEKPEGGEAGFLMPEPSKPKGKEHPLGLGGMIREEKASGSKGATWINPLGRPEGMGWEGSETGGIGGNKERESAGGQAAKSVSSSAGLAGYLGAARLKIEKAKRYPKEALRKNWEGRVVLFFQINRRGEVGEIKVLRSSGHWVLDQEGIATLRRASPFPPPPNVEKEKLELEVPLLFRLEEKK